MRRVVIPGEVIGDAVGPRVPYGVFKEGNKLLVSVYGLLEPEKGTRVTPLNGKYIPRPGDIVIGIVLMGKHSGYIVDINSAYTGYLPVPRQNSRMPTKQQRLFPGDVITVKVVSRDEVGNVLLESPRRLVKGKLIEVKPTKIPRIFGKSGSMLNLIKRETGIQIIVGRNGRIWLRGDRSGIIKAERVIRFIEENAHMYGVTDYVRSMLEDNKKDDGEGDK